MIELHDVEKYYGKNAVLKGVDLEVAKGEFVAVAGSSGSGKSTLLNLIGGMDRPEKGRIVVQGAEISSYPDEKLTLYRKRGIGFVFQFFNLLPNITVFENVRIPLLLNGVGETERVSLFLARIGLEGKESRYPHELSGGEQQRVAIARALVHDPAIILADEPTGSLDSRTGEAIMGLMKQLIREEAKTIVLVTHEEYVSRHADRTVRIKDGVIAA
ncbi:MAG: ABC transporter ATP-binding protein [Nitrospiraceae bacterium]|nr:ABC transporter ATP-binding protein [Nitrospiraceae bacterium]